MTTYLLAFGCTLLVAVLVSALASRSPLSTSAVFLAGGVVVGPLVLDVVSLDAHVVERLSEVALFATLFADGQDAPWSVLRRTRGDTGRSLLVGMPLTFGVVAVLAHVLVGMGWLPSLVLGAVLAPTDPVFASALVGREEVPARVRQLLNVESGLNDGLALPAVLVLVGTAGGSPEGWSTSFPVLVAELAAGAALGVVVPWLVGLLLHLPGIGAVEELRPLGPFAVAVLLFGVCDATGANPYLAAFLAGSTIATLRPTASHSFERIGELTSEMTKGAALLAFGSVLTAGVLGSVGWRGWVLAALVVVVARPLPALACLVGTTLTRRERVAVAWFGPKGFASVAYALVVAASSMPEHRSVLALAAVSVLISVVAHSSTDVVVARWWSGEPQEPPRERVTTARG